MQVKGAWNQLRSSGKLDSQRKFKENHFLQVLILPYGNGNGDHDCYVTTRTLILPEQYNGPKGAPGFDLFNFVIALSIAAGVVLSIPFYGLWLYWPVDAMLH